MSHADQERAALRRHAETEPDDTAAVAAALLVHAIVRDGPRWWCRCGHTPRLGEMSARHQADEVLALLRRRGTLT